MRPLASSAYGKRTVTLPEGVKPEDVFTVSAPGNEPGFVAMLTPKKRTGGFGRRFIRADVNVTAVDTVNPDVVPDSDTSRVLTEARDRVTSAFFLESDISKAGLGAWVPYEDFTLGDYAWISVFGHRVKLPVTRIEPLTTDHSVVDWKVHVGGQLVSDEQARMVENEAVHKAVVEDRRELAGLDAKASSAVSTAESAQADASEALSEVRDKRGIIQGYVDQAEAAVAAGREHNAAAEEKLAESRTVLDGAVGKLAEAEKLLDESDLTLEENRRLRDEVAKIRTGVEGLLGDAKASVAEVQARVAEAEDIRVQVAGLLEDASARVAEGKRLLADSQAERRAGEAARTDAVAAAERAAKLAGEAEAALNSVKGEREQVAQILADVKSQKQAADKALTDAGGVLTQAKKAAKDAGTSKAEVDALYRRVVDKHDEVLNLHQEMITAQADINEKQQTILDAHQEAIDLTAKGVRALAGSQAAMAGSLAYFEQCLEASNKAIEAVAEATELNTQAIKRLDEVARLHEEAIREQAEATEKLAQATETLSTAQGLIKQQTENNSKALAITNRAVRAHGGAIGGMAASISMLQESQEETQKATEQALSATQANANAIRVQEAVGRARDEAVMAAAETATGARAIALATKYAVDVNAWATDMVKLSEPRRLLRNRDGLRTFSPRDAKTYLEVVKSGTITIKGAWTGLVTVMIIKLDGRVEAKQVFVERGLVTYRHDKDDYIELVTSRYVDYPAWDDTKHQSITITANVNTYPNGKLPDKPQIPKELIK